tara:strand:+ start:529 stop:645 length:117 start_codon:yes stop_codon:yes gene_type:complete
MHIFAYREHLFSAFFKVVVVIFTLLFDWLFLDLGAQQQ